MARKLPDAFKAHQFKKGGGKVGDKEVEVKPRRAKVKPKTDTKLASRRKAGTPKTPDLRK